MLLDNRVSNSVTFQHAQVMECKATLQESLVSRAEDSKLENNPEKGHWHRSVQPEKIQVLQGSFHCPFVETKQRHKRELLHQPKESFLESCLIQ